MINQNWKVSPDEVKRILEMHENATKKHYLIKEQQQVKVGEKTTTTNKDISLDKKSFPTGFYSIDKLGEGKKDLDNKLQEIAQFAKENNGTQVNIQIEVGESQVTNYDREQNTPLGPGELAELRGQKLQEYLTNYFQGLVKSGYLTTMPNIPRAQTNVELKTQIHSYVKGKDKPNDPKYLDDQYVKFKISLSATKTEDVFECLVNLVIDVSYYHQPDKKYPCRGGHTCDGAVFEIYLDSVLIGIANLNNRQCNSYLEKNPKACDRMAKLVVTDDMVKKITSNPKWNKKTLVLSTKCISQNCHTSIQEVRIVNGSGEEIYHECVNPQSARGNTNFKILAVLDKCGKPIQGRVDDNVNAEEAKALSDNVSGERTNKIYEVAKTQGLNIIPENTPILSRLLQKKIVKIAGTELNENFYTIIFDILSKTPSIKFSNILGGTKNEFLSFEPGQTVKFNYPVQTVNFSKNKIQELIEDNRIIQIPNTNAYIVIMGFLIGKKEYFTNFVLIPKKEV
jgi:hypothetical protein